MSARGMCTVEAMRARCVIDPVSGCWLWQGGCAMDGTPRLYTVCHAHGDKRSMSGPKGAWNIAFNQAPPHGKLVFRGCGQRLCLNPVHLRLARDKAEIGLHWRRAGYRKGTALESRRANQRIACVASGKTPTDEAIVRAIRAAPPGLSQRELAALHGIARQTVSRIQRGESHRHLLETAA